MFSYALSEREAGSDAGVDEVPRGGRRRRLGAQRPEVLDHQRRDLEVLHGDGRDRARRRAAGASRPSSSTPTTPASPWGRRSASSASTARRPARSCSTTAGSRPTGSSASPGTGFQTAMRTLDHTRVTIGAQALGHRPGRARRLDRLRQGAPAVRQDHRRLPGRAVPARRHGDEGGGGAGADLRRRGAQRARGRRPDVLRRGRQVLRLGHRDGGHDRRRAGVRRRRLRPRQPGGAATCATPRSPRSTRAPTRSSAW